MVQFGLSGLNRNSGRRAFQNDECMRLPKLRAIYEQVRRNYVFLAPFFLEDTKIRRLTLTVVQG